MTLKIQDLGEDLAMTENSANPRFHCIKFGMSRCKKKT